MDELEKIRNIFVFSENIDEDLKEENLQTVKEWEESLIKNEAMSSWMEHDVTKQIIGAARANYKNVCMQLMMDRKLSEEARISLYAKQDAMLWIILLGDKEAKNTVERIRKEIRAAINAT